MLYDLESHAKDGRCELSRNEDIRRSVGKLVEKQTLVCINKYKHLKTKLTAVMVIVATRVLGMGVYVLLIPLVGGWSSHEIP